MAEYSLGIITTIKHLLSILIFYYGTVTLDVRLYEIAGLLNLYPVPLQLGLLEKTFFYLYTDLDLQRGTP